VSLRRLPLKVLIVFAVAAALVPLLGIESAALRLVDAGASPPTWAHPLGTNRIGQDWLMRLWAALATAFSVGGLAVLIGMLFALIVGMASAGIFGRFVGQLAATSISIVDGMPGYLLLACVALALAPSPWAPAIAVAAVLWSESARLVRSQVRDVLASDWHLAGVALGIPPWRRVRSHVLPALLPLVQTQAALQFALAVKIEAALSVLGLLSGQRISLGQLLAESGTDLVLGKPIGFIAVTLTLAALALALLGLARSGSRAQATPY
jgi:ABC-type dipeptide/oligopeptide/nickel transport system permease subunit